jgi:transposase-like protein
MMRPDNSELGAMYRESGSVPAVAAKLGVAFETARRWLLEAGVELRPKGRPSATADRLNPTELAARYQSGESIAQLGRRYGVSPATIRSRLIDVGVELRPRPGWKY